MGYQRNLSGSCCSSCAHGGPCGSGLGADLVSTGIDTTPRPGESVQAFALRFSQEMAEYQKFVERQRAQGIVVSPPLLPPGPRPPAPDHGSGSSGKIIVALGILGVAYFVLMRKR